MEIGDRMKRYESVPKSYLTRRVPVIIRIDGKAFHTFTKNQKVDKPFDTHLHMAMSRASVALIEGIQGAQISYTQSDEISIFVSDWEQLNTEAWFDYNVQKMVSISASIATAAFNLAFFGTKQPDFKQLALFDARVFNIPKEDVCNYFIWRQQDAVRNSINVLGQSKFSQKELQGKKTSQVQEMLFSQHGINWNDYLPWQKRGSCVYRNPENNAVISDFEIPTFTQDRGYIEKFRISTKEK